MTMQSDLFISMVLMTLVVEGSYGLEYLVGDSVWSIPPFPDFYTDWSSSLVFLVGDSLYFDFESEFYNVIQVSRLGYQSCTAKNPFKIFNSGPAIIQLTNQGAFYFICNISNYCSLGQKLSIIVQQPPPNITPNPSPSSSPFSGPFPPLLAPEPVIAGGGIGPAPPMPTGTATPPLVVGSRNNPSPAPVDPAHMRSCTGTTSFSGRTFMLVLVLHVIGDYVLG